MPKNKPMIRGYLTYVDQVGKSRSRGFYSGYDGNDYIYEPVLDEYHKYFAAFKSQEWTMTFFNTEPVKIISVHIFEHTDAEGHDLK